MKKTVIAIALSLAIPAAAAAEFGQGPGYRQGGPGGPNLDKIAVILDLTEEQKAAMEAIREEQKEKRQALREDAKNRLSAVLTPEQREKWTQLKEMRKERRKGRGGCGAQGQGQPQ